MKLYRRLVVLYMFADVESIRKVDFQSVVVLGTKPIVREFFFGSFWYHTRLFDVHFFLLILLPV